MAKAASVRYQELGSELEAIFVEADLIREHQPHYNIRLRDDKSPIYVVITSGVFPRVLTARRTDLDREDLRRATVIGPFQSSYMLKKVLRAVRPSFGWCNQAAKQFKDEEDWQQRHQEANLRPCFYAHLHICSGACVGKVDPHNYKNMIRRLRMFLKGQTRAVQKELKKEIETAAKQQDFELAAQLKAQYEAIETITNPEFKVGPDIALPRLQSHFSAQAVKQISQVVRTHQDLPLTWRARRIEGYDVSNVSGKYATVSMVVFIDGAPSKKHYRIFHIRRKDTPDDYGMLREALERRQNHAEWGEPDLILIDGGKGQLSSAQASWQWASPVASIAKRPDRLMLPATKNRDRLEKPVRELAQAGQLLQQIRDESHRFAKKHVHKRLRQRDIIL